MLPHSPGGRFEEQVALAIQVETAGALVADRDPARVGAGGKYEIVFQPASVAVVDDVDAGIDLVIPNAFESRNASSPGCRIADQIIHDPGQRRLRLPFRIGGSDQGRGKSA